MKITLCGSLKFEKAIKEWEEALTLNCHTVYSMSVWPSDKGNNKNWYSNAQKTILDLVHLHKVANSDFVLVVDVNGYIGESTLREILFAHICQVPVYYASKQPTVGKLTVYFPYEDTIGRAATRDKGNL